jgi:BlaI family transcriptional regulator, penicillinase repressor
MRVMGGTGYQARRIFRLLITEESDVVGSHHQLGGRERQIVEVVYRLGEASVAEVRHVIPDPPSYSAVRATLNLLVSKNLLSYRHQGKRYLYRPVTPKKTARRSALRDLVQTFFSGRPVDAVAALLDGSAGRLKPEDIERIKKQIQDAEARS